MATREDILKLFAEPEFSADNYKGEVDENGLPHGEGTMKYAPKSTLYWLGYAHYAVAPKRYQGQWCHGVKCGEGKMIFYAPDCQHYSYAGSWVNDLPEGSGSIRVLSDKGRESITPCNFVAGMREGLNTTVEFGKTYECEYKDGLKSGEGVCTLADGRKFKSVWEKDCMQVERCSFVEPIEAPTLLIEVNHKGFDYNRTILALVEGTVGEHTVATALPIVRDSGFEDTEPLVTILAVETGALKYSVGSIYSECGSVVVGTIAVGETVKHKSEQSDSATIYDEDYDYDIIRSIKITCK